MVVNFNYFSEYKWDVDILVILVEWDIVVVDCNILGFEDNDVWDFIFCLDNEL